MHTTADIMSKKNMEDKNEMYVLVLQKRFDKAVEPSEFKELIELTKLLAKFTERDHLLTQGIRKFRANKDGESWNDTFQDNGRN